MNSSSSDTRNKTRRFDVSKLSDGAIRQDIEMTIGNRFAALSDVSEDAETEWKQFRDAVCEVAEQKIGYRKKNVKKWISPATLIKQEDTRQAKIELNQDTSNTFRKDKPQRAQKELKESITEDKNKYYRNRYKSWRRREGERIVRNFFQ